MTTAGTAGAQTSNVPVVPGPTGFSADRFEPSERGSEWFVMDSLDFRGNARPALGVVGEWAHNPLTLRDGNGNQLTNLVSDQLTMHLGASLVLLNSLRLAADLPVALVDSGNGVVAGGQQFFGPVNRAALGDFRFAADLRLVGEYGSPFEMTLGAAVWMPSGEQKEYTGDGLARAEPRIFAAGEIGAFAYGVKLGLLVRAKEIDYPDAPLGDEIVYGVSAGLRLANRKLLIGPELYGSTGVKGDSFFKTYTTPLEVIVGGHYTIGDDWRVGAGFGPGLTQGYGTPDWRALASLEWVPGYTPPPARIGDRDGDAISDDRDMCPDNPGHEHPEAPLTNGCPPASDRDSDGVVDRDDACPDVPGVKTDDPKTNGCPPDKDGDGVADKDDACPDVPGVKTDDPKTNGCPPDRDKDGIVDNLDACPDTPGVKTDDPKTNGCPPDPDRDKDGIANEQDACPDTPGEKTEDPKTNGCPKAFVQNNEIKINEQVKFKFNSAVILKDSDALLGAVAKILSDHPELQRIRIEGHTDNVGNKAYNQSLSEKRAAAVVAWLTKHGIDKGRLYSQGFGAERPLDSNTTEEGRKQNRRVEFHIEKQGDSAEAPPTSAGAKGAAAKPADGKPADGKATAGDKE